MRERRGEAVLWYHYEKVPFLKGNELPVHQNTQFFQLILSNPKNCCIFAENFDNG
jgi:hypothetical protein